MENLVESTSRNAAKITGCQTPHRGKTSAVRLRIGLPARRKRWYNV